jgi:hypothetical protein
MRTTNAIPSLIFIVIFSVGLGLAYSRFAASDYPASLGIAVGSFVLAVIASSATKIANQWERTIVLRLGRFLSMKGTWALLYHSNRRYGPVLDRSSSAHEFIQSRKDPHQGHGSR